MEIIKSGINPVLGIFSGIHGDEWKIINPVRNTINKYREGLKPFLYIPVCSPSAVKTKTRINQYGNDINRSFVKNPADKEVIDIINVLKTHAFNLCIDFHEDHEFQGVYVYDSTDNRKSKILKIFRQEIKRINIPLYSGIDDLSDTKLGGEVVDGYRVALAPEKDKQGNFIYEGFFDHWALIEGKTQRWLTLEVPSSLDQIQKKKIIGIFIETFVLENI